MRQQESSFIVSYLAGSHCTKHGFLRLMVVENEGLLSPISVSLPALQTVLNSHTTYYKQKHI